MMSRSMMLLAVLIALPGTAACQNLLVNPGFTNDLSGWMVTGAAVWSGSQDAHGSPSSGSALITAVSWPDSRICQCVALKGGPFFEYGGSYRAPSGQTLSRITTLTSLTFSPVPPGPDCLPWILIPPEIRLDPSQADTWFSVGPRVASPPPGAVSVLYCASVSSHSGIHRAYFDNAVLQATDTVLPLQNSFFNIRVTWETPEGVSGVGHAVQLSEETGYFWFLDPSGPEIVIKVVNACFFNNRFWLFVGGLTNIKVVVTVTDVFSGASRRYVNPQGSPFQPIQDTDFDGSSCIPHPN